MTGINELAPYIGGAMLLAGVPYVFRDKLKRIIRWPGKSKELQPAEVLQLVERAKCPDVRKNLQLALNCLLDRQAPTEAVNAKDA